MASRVIAVKSTVCVRFVRMVFDLFEKKKNCGVCVWTGFLEFRVSDIFCLKKLMENNSVNPDL